MRSVLGTVFVKAPRTATVRWVHAGRTTGGSEGPPVPFTCQDGACVREHKATAVTHPYHTVLGYPSAFPSGVRAIHSSVGEVKLLRQCTWQHCGYKSQGEVQRNPSLLSWVRSPPARHFSTFRWGTLCRLSGLLWSLQLCSGVALVSYRNIPTDKETVTLRRHSKVHTQFFGDSCIIHHLLVPQDWAKSSAFCSGYT